MVIVPLIPCRSPVPESGTTEMLAFGVPRVMVALCCSTKLPVRPFSVPVTRSIAT